MALQPPYMPGPRMGDHATRELRLARDELESVKKELAIRAKSAYRYYEQWQKTNNAALEQTWKTESMLYGRLAKQIVPPAAKRYLQALRKVIAEGGRPVSELAADLLKLTSGMQLLGMEAHVRSEADLTHMAERICTSARGAYKAAPSERTLDALVSAGILAQMVGAQRAADAVDEDVQKAMSR